MPRANDAPRRTDAPPAAAARPRLVFVNRYFHPDCSATSQILMDLLRRLPEYERHVVCSRQLYEDPAAHLPEEEMVEGIHVHRLSGSRFGRMNLAGRAADYASFYVACAARLPRLLRNGDVVVAKTDPPLLGVLVAVLARIRRAVLINWLQDVFPEVATRLQAVPLPAAVAALLARLRDRSLFTARVNVVLGEEMQAYLQGRGVPAPRLAVIENWADETLLAPRPAADSALRRREALGDAFVVGYSGNLGRAHDHLAILGAARALRDDPGIVFLMTGGGANMAQLRAAARSEGITPLRFLPYQPREALADSLAAADIHLLSLLPALDGLIVPSKFYGILAAARPVIYIGSHDAEIARLIREADCGHVVAPGDGAALASAVQALRDDPARVRAMGERAHALFLSRYTASRAAAQWQALLAGPLPQAAAPVPAGAAAAMQPAAVTPS